MPSTAPAPTSTDERRLPATGSAPEAGTGTGTAPGLAAALDRIGFTRAHAAVLALVLAGAALFAPETSGCSLEELNG